MCTVWSIPSPWSAAINTDNSRHTNCGSQMKWTGVTSHNQVGSSENLSQIEQTCLIGEIHGTAILNRVELATQAGILNRLGPGTNNEQPVIIFAGELDTQLIPVLGRPDFSHPGRPGNENANRLRVKLVGLYPGHQIWY